MLCSYFLSMEKLCTSIGINIFFPVFDMHVFLIPIPNNETISLENNNFAMAGLEPAILDFGRPMPYPFGHMAFMDSGELGFNIISKTMVK